MTSSRHSSLSAFTLLEMLIAVMVIGILLVAINTVFFSALRLRNTTANAFEEILPLERAVAIIQKDLANLVVPGGALSGELQTAFAAGDLAGQGSPEFYTSTGVIDHTSPWSQIQRISFALLNSTNQAGARDLFRVIQRNPLPPGSEDRLLQPLLANVRQIGFLYLDGNQWVNSWDSSTAEESKLPAAIKVLIDREPLHAGSVPPAPVEIVVPIAAMTLTNQTEEAAE